MSDYPLPLVSYRSVLGHWKEVSYDVGLYKQTRYHLVLHAWPQGTCRKLIPILDRSLGYTASRFRWVQSQRE